MAHFITYLTFNGNCRDAMEFYRECLGGELFLQTIGESPLSSELPKQLKNYILQARLQRYDSVLLATDLIEGQRLVRGNAVSIMVECGSEVEIMEYYYKLSAGGKPTHPVKRTHWGALFGMLTDKFGNHWILSYH